MEQIITTNGLTKVYGKKTAVKDVSMHVPTGCIYGLIGRNGAGKTTIMRMLSGLSEPTRGSYALFGKTGIEMRKLRRRVGILIHRLRQLSWQDFAGDPEGIHPRRHPGDRRRQRQGRLH